MWPRQPRTAVRWPRTAVLCPRTAVLWFRNREERSRGSRDMFRGCRSGSEAPGTSSEAALQDQNIHIDIIKKYIYIHSYIHTYTFPQDCLLARKQWLVAWNAICSTQRSPSNIVALSVSAVIRTPLPECPPHMAGPTKTLKRCGGMRRTRGPCRSTTPMVS